MKRVLVTGGSKGIGLAVCSQLLAGGDQVIAVSRSSSPGLARLEASYETQLTAIRCDLSAEDGPDRLIEEANLLAGVDGFVANAAVGTEGLLTLQSRREIEHTLQLNLQNVILLTRGVIKGMLPSGGSIVFVSSIVAIEGSSGLSVYGATKGALLSFSRSIAREYGRRRIRSNCVLPGFVATEMTAGFGEAQRARIVRRTPLQRLGSPEEIASAICFLLGDASGFISGTELIADGGMTC